MPNGSSPSPSRLIPGCEKGFEHDKRLSIVELEVDRDREDFVAFRSEIKQEFSVVKTDMQAGFDKIQCGMKELTTLSLKTKLMWSGLGTLLVLIIGALVKVLIGV